MTRPGREFNVASARCDGLVLGMVAKRGEPLNRWLEALNLEL